MRHEYVNFRSGHGDSAEPGRIIAFDPGDASPLLRAWAGPPHGGRRGTADRPWGSRRTVPSSPRWIGPVLAIAAVVAASALASILSHLWRYYHG